ncbi:hypothetical protein LSCM1_03204 [Leishmania martiniquensis]|uniref:Arf-GAP domain-containing protein n=1 Tax=Leishmania martiniquensis TaxID=1580590 RepID=A0A836GUZ8_9TRYP|nr:hypothetical protein LSCM1_03204 [Leishmania martiniquensis]
MSAGFHHWHTAEGRSGHASTADRTVGSNGYLCTGHTATSRLNNTAAPPRGAHGAGVAPQQLQRFDVLLRRPENRECFDCGTKQPRWASTNLGIFFCLRCAGIHRAMGTHVSKVKSTNMDAWMESLMCVMEHIGNARGRLLYEYNMPASARVTGTTDTCVLERAIRSKYERKLYYNPRFTELFAQFMETPIEEVGSGGAVHSAPPPKAHTPPPVADAPGQVQQQQHAMLEELWGAPVSSPSTSEPSQQVAQSSPAPHTNVAELFSGTYPTHGASGKPSAGGGRTTLPPPAQGNTAASLSSASPVSAGNDSDWFAAQFGGTTSSLVGSASSGGHSGMPLPNTLHSQSSPPMARDDTEDLFIGTNASVSGSSRSGTKNEILSLFDSAPLAGAGGLTSSDARANAGRYPMAWQPQSVKPH